MLSIIIPTFRRTIILRETYNSLLLAINTIHAEIIIVNDDSEKSLIDFSQELSFNSENTIVLNNKGKGVASARNTGAARANGSIFLFLDDDILINKNTISAILKLHSKFDKILSTPLWVYSDEMLSFLNDTSFGQYRIKNDYTSIRGEQSGLIPNEENIYYANSLASFCLSIKREHYLYLNGMDEDFPYAGCEDQEFCMRAKEMGFGLLLDENNFVFHNELDRLDRNQWLQRQFRGVQGFVLLAQKFPNRKETTLWKENTPLSKEDTLKIKLKKILKLILRQPIPLTLIENIVLLFQKFSASNKLMFKLYSLQAGLYINSGFIKSYKKKCI